ncbi:Protein HemX [BD1-7 clade bacterium]|uniref:Protein HemX n=1 Tax=BD1-7 clade bacterium TaxID=2029982 RepID=A0A5S9MUM6_9GAMM|nr:Protein HemX [BD1-7 clade bacterium]CAA0084012.1 Protein HemX [BD1-7 clade bacterium]CAA0115950.1 Protein HemX [BD1-7 clade bacterium]
MSDKNNETNSAVSRPRASDANHEQPDTALETKKGGFTSGLVVVLLILLVAGGGGGYYVWTQAQQELGLMRQVVEKMQGQLKSKDESVVEFKEQLSKISAETQSQDLVLNDHLRTLEDNLTKMKGQFKKLSDATLSSESWLLAEVEYLLKIADQRILMREDVKGAVSILKSAETLIKKMPVEDRGLLNVRVAIAKDMASLEAYKDIDVPGTYAKLTALGDTVERLPLLQTAFNSSVGLTDEEKKKQPKTLAAINETLSGYLIVRHHDADKLRALLSDEEAASLKDSMRLALEQSQTSLLRGDQRTYDQSLGKVRNWIHQYFVANNFKVKMAIKKIDELMKVQVENDLPDISGSQQALKRYLNERMRQKS